MNKHITTSLLISILLVSAFIRLYRSTDFIPFWKEQVDDMLAIEDIWRNLSSGALHNLSLKGQAGTYRWTFLDEAQRNPVYHGIAYYYILLPSAVISQFDPYGVVLFLIMLGTCVVYLLYKVGMLLFGKQNIALMAAFLGATSFWLSAYSRWIWTPSMVPFFSLLSLVSFLKIMKGSKKWWYALALSLSLGSQVHNSGYVPLAFFSFAIFFWRPKWPERWERRFLIFFLLLFPMLPTFISEVSSGFAMYRSLGRVGVDTLSSMVADISVGVSKFLASVIGPTTENTSVFYKLKVSLENLIGRFGQYTFVLLMLAGLFVMKEVMRRKRGGFSMQLILLWWLFFLPIPAFVENLYLDQGINDYSFMNNLVFAFPMLLVTISAILVWLWRKHMIFKVAVLSVVISYVTINIATMRDFLWTGNQKAWAYNELQALATIITREVRNKPYEVYIYRYSEGSFVTRHVYEPLYFLHIWEKPMPERFNGVSFWGVPEMRLRNQNSETVIIVIDKTYLDEQKLPDGAVLVDQTQGHHIYRTDMRSL